MTRRAHDSRRILAKQLLPQLLEGDDPRLAVLRMQLAASSISIKPNKDCGFYAHFSVPSEVEKVHPPDFCGGSAKIKVETLSAGAGCLLHVKNGVLSHLDVYTYYESWEYPQIFEEVSVVEPVIPGEHIWCRGFGKSSA